ncbi:MAG: sulfotransferase [Candidatus Electrothrix scaldis]|nr:MAG: sulfotransferase [Candidatus Electrothrix sp. GW3-3]
MGNELKFDQPVIIVGFSHSGTRLFAELLYDVGVFQVGQSKTFEWNYIQQLNDKIWSKWYDLTGISVGRIKQQSLLICKQELLENLIGFGYKGKVWGFKDPRGTITLPAWLERFPKAKVVIVIRHPYDVIGTLGDNYSKFSPNKRRPQEEIRFWSELWVKSYSFMFDFLENNFSDSFSLVKYEELCSNPMHVIKQVVEKLHIEVSNYSSVNEMKIYPASKKYRKFLNDGHISWDGLRVIAGVTESLSGKCNYDLDIS